ncbi:MAG: chromophore lyase CpcT/CpeT [Gammaproteobacteria bacterium]|nr:chromophore lyase CpcT/CpeT [Gammaproteobacteria bacterium]
MVDRAGRSRRHPLAGARLAAALCALGACAGCTDQAKLREAELSQLLAWLPGSYDNAAQAATPAQQRVALVIVRVYAPRLGHHALYAQETALDDPLRVMSQRILNFEVDPKRGIVETVYAFKDPLRWRDGQQNPEIFTGVVPEDLRSAPGCELLWKKGEAHFTGAPDATHCQNAVGGAAELSADSLRFGGLEFRKGRPEGS